jgi:hypothetical protein
MSGSLSPEAAKALLDTFEGDVDVYTPDLVAKRIRQIMGLLKTATENQSKMASEFVTAKSAAEEAYDKAILLSYADPDREKWRVAQHEAAARQASAAERETALFTEKAEQSSRHALRAYGQILEALRSLNANSRVLGST